MTKDEEPESCVGAESMERRHFLEKCGRFAAVTPPAVIMLLSTTLSTKAIAASGGNPGVPPRQPIRRILRLIFGRLNG